MYIGTTQLGLRMEVKRTTPRFKTLPKLQERPEALV